MPSEHDGFSHLSAAEHEEMRQNDASGQHHAWEERESALHQAREERWGLSPSYRVAYQMTQSRLGSPAVQIYRLSAHALPCCGNCICRARRDHR